MSCFPVTIIGGGGGSIGTSSHTYTWIDHEKESLKREIEDLKDLNKTLTEKLCWLIENPEKIEEFPALREAYREYLMIRKLTLGE